MRQAERMPIMSSLNSGLGCLAGKILRVDLAEKRIWIQDSREYVLETLGGRGINSMIMLEEMGPETRWNDPENLLCLAPGSLAGSLAPGACRVDIATKNVFSGGKGSSNVGGFWGAELKFAGYDAVIIQGKSEKPVYLLIRDDQVEIRDASFIWGQTVSASEEMLKQELGDPAIRMALIGPAGENRVRGSAVIVDTSRAAGGSGVGCVMGDKRLKGVVVRGTGAVRPARPERFMREVDRCLRQCMAEPKLPSMRKALHTFFSDPDFISWDMIMTVRNGQDDYWPMDKRERLMNRRDGVPSLRKGVRACHACPAGCQPFMKIPADRPYGPMSGEGFWVNSILSHACRVDVDQPEAVTASWLLTNDLGLDSDFAGGMLAWAFELYELGKITKADTGGLELSWGNGRAFYDLLNKLARREGIGDILGGDPQEAIRHFGEDTGYYLSRIGGQPTVESLRVAKGWSLAVCTSPVAGRHLRGATVGNVRFGPRPRSGDLDPVGQKGQAEQTYWQARTKELEDCLGICNYCGTWSGANFMEPRNYAALVSAGMGLDLDEARLMEHYAPIGRNLEKAFNTLHTNLDRKDERPPERLCKEGIKSGPYMGIKAGGEDLENLLDEYYALWGWDIKTGLQTRSGLKKLGLDSLITKLSGAGRLIED